MRHLLTATALLLPIAANATNYAPEPPAPAPPSEPPARERSEPATAPADRSNQCDSTYSPSCMANGPAGGVTVQSTTPRRADRPMTRAEDYDIVLEGYRCRINADLVWWCRRTD